MKSLRWHSCSLVEHIVCQATGWVPGRVCTKAIELQNRAGERERMLIDGDYQWLGQNDRQKANESFERMLARFPREGSARSLRSSIGNSGSTTNRSTMPSGQREGPRLGLAAWNTMGYSYLLKRDFVNAIDAFKRYAEAEPGNANPVDSLGDTYTDAGLYDEAIAAYQRAFEIQPDFYGYSALWKRAEVHLLKGDLAQATANAEQFVRNTDDRYRYLGQLYAR